ncbi:hypothetical protein ACFYV7_35620 [Nocardia suismassiliense]|uniref:Uncharacterized protein n=1 Tax=Nocardia suismassiliense TaxID=2077092 RepID=A0ABW6R618_9NOCA
MLLVGCGTTGGGTASGRLAGGATVPVGATFDADVTVTGADVTVTWRVVNRSSKELLIPTLVPHENTWPQSDAYIVPADNNIEIAQRFFDWPDEVENLATPPSVGILRVRDGTTESRTIRVPRPLTAYHPFGNGFDDGPPALPSDPAGVVFCLGIVPQPYPPALRLDQADGVEFAVHGRVPYAHQHRFCTEPVAFQ